MRVRGHPMKRCRSFTLVEPLVALALALVLVAAVARGMMALTSDGERLALLRRERAFQRRVLALMRAELEAARSWGLGTGAGAECPLGGRAPVLRMELENRGITYSVGEAPSSIWRGRVLMRCGPAYGLEGELSGGAAQNRVVLDGLEQGGLQVEREAPGVVKLRLRQGIPLRGGGLVSVGLETRAGTMTP